jgi:hypothetical protein
MRKNSLGLAGPSEEVVESSLTRHVDDAFVIFKHSHASTAPNSSPGPEPAIAFRKIKPSITCESCNHARRCHSHRLSPNRAFRVGLQPTNTGAALNDPGHGRA